MVMYYGECPLSRNFYVRTHVKSMRVNKKEAMYESLRVKVERETFHTLSLLYLGE